MLNMAACSNPQSRRQYSPSGALVFMRIMTEQERCTMATMEIERYSLALSKVSSFRLILPEKLPPQLIQGNPHYNRPAKVLFLLHGFSGSSTDWLYHTPAHELSMKYNLAICFPDGGVSFFLDREATGAKYCTYVGKELPAYLRETFGLAASPEDTLIGGNSMGGYGALHTALSFPETFGRVFALSSANIVEQVAKMSRETFQNNVMANYDYYEETFGDPAKVRGSDRDLKELVRRIKARGGKMPEIFMACGAQDFLLEANRSFHSFLESEGVPVKYVEGDGIHDWEYWIPRAKDALEHFLGK